MSTVINPLLVSLQQLNTQPVSTTGSPTALTITAGAHTTLTAATESTDINFNLARTVQHATGDYATQRFFRIQPATLGFVGGTGVTTAVTATIEGATNGGTNADIRANIALQVGGATSMTVFAGGAPTMAYRPIDIPAHTLTLVNNGAGLSIASSAVSGMTIGQITITDASAVTVTNAASLYIAAAPVAAGSVTLSNTYALWADAGNVRIDGSILLGTTTAPAVDGSLSMTQSVATTGSPTQLLVTGGAHTTLTKNTEATDINFNLARTVQFATVDTSFFNQRAVRFQAPTYGFVGSSTIGKATNVSIGGGPIAGTNAIFTNSIGLSVDSWLANGATNQTVSVEPAGIATGFGAMTEISGLFIGKAIAVTLGDQTANLTNYYGLNQGVVTFTSTTLTRTVTGNAVTHYIAGAPVASTNVTFSNIAYSLWIDSGASRFDGAVIKNQGTDIASATTIVIPTDGNVFELTGTTAVTLITKTNYQDGHTITLIANENVTITNGTATSGSDITIKLAGAGNFAMTADDTLTLCLCSTTAGAQAWREICRTAI